MSIKDRMTDDIVRFYISPEGKLSFANVKKVFNARPYDNIFSQVESVFSVKENTDINYDSSFSYSLFDSTIELFLMISMVGRYAIIYSARKDIFTENYENDSQLFFYLKNKLSDNDIELVNGQTLKYKICPAQAEYSNFLNKKMFYYLFERG